MRRLLVCPWIVVLALCGCETLPKQPQRQTVPSLDKYLANDCALIGDTPNADDYDVLQSWVQENLIPKYVDCAIRHRKTVDAWPKSPSPKEEK
jgi:hypothetical protein